MDALVKARFEQGRLISLPSDFVHSFEVSDIRKHIYADWLVAAPMTLERLHGWQASLFPTGYSGVKKIKIAEFRTQDFSRSSLPSKRIEESLAQYLLWWREPPEELDPVLRSALAFFWFYAISPYEDGNFELACALSELALQEHEKTSQRCYDLALQLEDAREDLLRLHLRLLQGGAEPTVKQASVTKLNPASTAGDLTSWMTEFLRLFSVAVDSAYIIADKNFTRELFWKKHAALELNSRQRKILNYLLENQEAELNNRLYVEICKTTRESAKRDLTDLTGRAVLVRNGTIGRSVSYRLAE